MLTMNAQQLRDMFLFVARRLVDSEDFLTEIDIKIGDGDHGITVTKIAKLVNERTEAWDDASIKDFIDDLGMDVMAVRGGSAGPLYGTLIGGLGAQLGDDENELSADAVRRMFAGCLAEMQDITTAQVGDKTMMEGARASEGFASKFGRARSYGDRTIGTPDAGAVSTSLFLRGLANGASLPRS